MTPFLQIRSIAVPLPEDNIDTDVIFPARFLLLLEKRGLGRYAFHDRRFLADNGQQREFALDLPQYRGARILLAGAAFGSGSSREHAVWALSDLGIRCVIAVSIGDIFTANCIGNGIAPITLPRPTVEAMFRAAEQSACFEIDLVACTLRVGTGDALSFDILPGARETLLRGWDPITRIVENDGAAIRAFEARQRAAQPWLVEPNES